MRVAEENRHKALNSFSSPFAIQHFRRSQQETWEGSSAGDAREKSDGVQSVWWITKNALAQEALTSLVNEFSLNIEALEVLLV